MPLTHAPCLDPYGTVSACHYLLHSDGSAPNPKAAFDAWFADPAPDKRLCVGRWRVNEPIEFPSMYTQRLRGVQPDHSILDFRLTSPAGYGLYLDQMAGSSLEDIGFVGGGTGSNKIQHVVAAGVWPGRPGASDRNHFRNVMVSGGNISESSFGLYGVGDSDFTDLLVNNGADPTTAAAAISLHASNGNAFYFCEIHSYAAWGCTVMMYDSFRTKFDGCLISNSNPFTVPGSPSTPFPTGLAYFGLSGNIDRLTIEGNTQLFSDNGHAPEYAFLGIAHPSVAMLTTLTLARGASVQCKGSDPGRLFGPDVSAPGLVNFSALA